MKRVAALALPMLLLPTAGLSAPKQPWQSAKKLYPRQAECIVRRQSQKVKDWLELLSGTKSERRSFDLLQVDFPVCFGSAHEEGANYAFESNAVREALIRYSLKANWAKIPQEPPARLASPSWYPAEALAELGAAEAVMGYSIGRCLARTDWGNSRALAGAELGSQDEKDAMAKLIALLPQCVPAKVTLRIDKPRLRAIVEETVYHASAETVHA